jgi:recombination protein RecA
MAEQQDRQRAVDQAISQIEKQFGRGSIMKMDEDKVMDVPVISTGSLALDLALGIGGVPRGRIVEIYGPEASGKTTLALHIGAEAQAAGGVVAYIDAEHALDVGYARRLGVDVDSLLVSQPDTGEQALDIAEILVRSGAIDALIIDSVAALVPRAELEGEMGDQHASQRLDIRRLGAIKEGDQVTGNRTRVKVVKNKIAPPFREAEFDIIYGTGISKEGDIIDLGTAFDIVEKSGAWYSFKGERMGQGRENAKKFLVENADIRNQIVDLIKEKTGLKKPKPEPNNK